MELMSILISISMLCIILFLVMRCIVGGPLGIITKILASFSFMVVGLAGAFVNGMSNASLFIVLGLLCGLIGDFVLVNKVVYKEHEDIYLNTGMFSFGLGHIFYFIAATITGIGLTTSISNNFTTLSVLVSLGASVVLTAGIMVLSKPLKLNFGKFFYQTLAYTLILTFMSCYSIMLAIADSTYWTFAVGICMIFVSDLILSNQYFGGQQDNKLFIVLNHLIYYVGQVFIAATMFLF